MQFGTRSEILEVDIFESCVTKGDEDSVLQAGKLATPIISIAK